MEQPHSICTLYRRGHTAQADAEEERERSMLGIVVVCRGTKGAHQAQARQVCVAELFSEILFISQPSVCGSELD